MEKQEKNKLILGMAIVILGTLVAIGCFALAGQSNSMFKIDGLRMVTELVKITFSIIWGFGKMFATLFWNMISASWLSATVTIGIIALVVLKYFYERAK